MKEFTRDKNFKLSFFAKVFSTKKSLLHIKKWLSYQSF